MIGSSGYLSTIARSLRWGHSCRLVGVSLVPDLNDPHEDISFITLSLYTPPQLYPSCSQLCWPPVHPVDFFYFPFLRKYMDPCLSPPTPPMLTTSLGLWIVAWLYLTLQLISTFEWVHTKKVFWVLSYFTQDDFVTMKAISFWTFNSISQVGLNFAHWRWSRVLLCFVLTETESY